MDLFRAMAVFIKVADEGSLTAAGRSLGLSLASVSREVTGLEAHLGNKLLNRSTRAVILTEHGALFYARAKRIMDEVHDAKLALVSVSAEISSQLRLSAPSLLGRHLLAPVLANYLQQFPKVRVDLILTDRAVNLIEDEIDIAIRIGALEDTSLVSRKFGAVRIVTCAAPSYIARREEPLSPHDLKCKLSVRAAGAGVMEQPARW